MRKFLVKLLSTVQWKASFFFVRRAMKLAEMGGNEEEAAAMWTAGVEMRQEYLFEKRTGGCW